MLVLALETVTRAGSLALGRDGAFVSRIGDASRTHGERLPAELLDLLAGHGASLDRVDVFAIIAGPGSFTGLRVGMAALQGLAIVRGRPIVPLSTLDALAESAAPHVRAPRTVVAACLDGHRGEVFSAAWRLEPGAAVEASEVVLPRRVGDPAALAADLHARAAGDPVVLVGDGAVRYATTLSPVATIVAASMPLAEVAARHAVRHPERGVGPHALHPIYVRRPDAELARDRASLAARPRA